MDELNQMFNNLYEDLVYRSYIISTFVLNQLDQFNRERENGSRSQKDIDKDINKLLSSFEILTPDRQILTTSNSTTDVIYNTIKLNRDYAMLNLRERKRN